MAHYPLDYHTEARFAAKVVECGAEMMVAERLVDTIYALQDSIKSLGWQALARRAIGSTAGDSVLSCAERPDSLATFRRLHRGLQIAADQVLEGTPTIFIDGRKFDRPPSMRALSDIVLARRR